MKIRYSLSLDCNPIGEMPLPKVLDVDGLDQKQKVEDFIAELEEECVKIDVFKRELPISMQLLRDAIDFCRQQLRETNRAESFSDANQSCPDSAEKGNWLASVQLWTQPNEAGTNRCRSGSAFLPFSKEASGKIGVGTDLALALVKEDKQELIDPVEEKTEKCKDSDVENSGVDGRTKIRRKARRCWSPDLHRRFVNALHVLGGSHVATPKQIRELMKVDGLTNDEVKSHLQKYRLHTRSPIPAPTTVAMPIGPAQLVVLGGVWVPSQYSTPTTLYNAHRSVSRGFYSSPLPSDGNHYITETRNGGGIGTGEFGKDGDGGLETSEKRKGEEQRKSEGSSTYDGCDVEDNKGSEVTLQI